jgi:hypothetical protein
MDDPNERIARLFDYLGKKHNEVAELLSVVNRSQTRAWQQSACKGGTNIGPYVCTSSRLDSDPTQ